jgi:peptide deformylase
MNKILQLGHPLLYEKCAEITKDELPLVGAWVEELASAMDDIRKTYGFGRGIAAPQLGIMKRLFYIDMGTPKVVINPVLHNLSDEKFEMWDDCMCFPNLLVKVMRHKSLSMKYLDENWEQQEWYAVDDVSELIQHEYDHLHGILCTMRAMDDKSFKWRG